jgi:hypothetical protein
MKCALIVIASVGILAVTVVMESANAQITRPYRAPPQPGSQGAGLSGVVTVRGAPTLFQPWPSRRPFQPAATRGGTVGNNQFWQWKWP